VEKIKNSSVVKRNKRRRGRKSIKSNTSSPLGQEGDWGPLSLSIGKSQTPSIQTKGNVTKRKNICEGGTKSAGLGRAGARR